MPATSRISSAFDDVFSSFNKLDSPGIAVGIVQNGEPIYTRCFGLASVEHGVPIKNTTVFEIGSITKQFTAFAILLLERDGKLDLNDDVRTYIPHLPVYDPPIRVRHCLYHTHGLSDWMWCLELAGPVSDYIPLKRAKQAILSTQMTMFPTGQAHSYNNTGYVLLAWIVAQVAGMPLPEFLRERVFDPLGMSRSVIPSDTDAFFPNQAQGYYRRGNGQLFAISGANDVHGDGGMLTSIDDMILWLQNFTARKVCDQAVLEKFFAPGHLDDGQVLRYGAAWMLQRYHGLASLHHGGLSNGFQSHVFWLPEVKIAVAVLGNVRPYKPWVLATTAANVLLRESGKQLPEVVEKSSSVRSAAKLGDVAGRYFTATGLPVRVDIRGDQIFIDIWLWGRPFDELSPDVFREAHSDDTVTFHRNKEGTVTHFTMETNDGACVHMHSLISRAIKYEEITIGTADLTNFEGRYVNDAIESAYTVIAEDEGLTARHLRCYDWHLRPIQSNAACSFESDFAQKRDWLGMVTFVRDPNGEVTGFRVRDTCLNLLFRKQLPVVCHERSD